MVTILIAEDDPQMQRLIQLYLRNYKDELEFVANGRIAEKRLKEKDFDLLITDLQMPEVDGVTLIKRLRERNDSIPVIVLSSYDKVEVGKILNKSNINSLRKPFESSDLITMINQMVSATDQNERLI